LINFIWYRIEFAHLKTGINSTLSFFNIVAYRVNFPMASGLTINSIQIGLTSLLTLYLIKNSSRFSTKFIFTILYFWNIYLLVVLDSRSPLLISLVLGIIVGFGLRNIISLITRYWIIVAILAIFIVHIFYNTDIFESIKRPGELEVGFLNRPKIWELAITHAFDDLRFLFGHGISTFGNMISQHTEHLHTTHNIFLQVLYDFGIFGILIMGVFLYKTMTILLKGKDVNFTLIFISFFLYGCLESVPSYYTFTTTLIFISLLVIIYNAKNESV
ncbi:MAG: O-antigen ligase family protein, partial [Flavobacteriaceae bacterium]|nr:O-antigen ligase family protein [Flavobacteriaceae bacterium]